MKYKCKGCDRLLTAEKEEGICYINCDICDRTTFFCGTCGEELSAKHQGFDCGLFCQTCDEWKVVTTYFPPIDADTSIYKIFVKKEECQNKQKLYCLSRISGVNYLHLRQETAAEIEIFHGRARDAAEILKNLQKHHINHIVRPPMPEEYIAEE